MQKFLRRVDVCVDVRWQRVALRVTCSFPSFCMSQTDPTVGRAGLSPHTSHWPDFDRHMLSLRLAAQSFEKSQWKMATMIDRAHKHHTHFQKAHTNLHGTIFFFNKKKGRYGGGVTSRKSSYDPVLCSSWWVATTLQVLQPEHGGKQIGNRKGLWRGPEPSRSGK